MRRQNIPVPVPVVQKAPDRFPQVRASRPALKPAPNPAGPAIADIRRLSPPAKKVIQEVSPAAPTAAPASPVQSTAQSVQITAPVMQVPVAVAQPETQVVVQAAPSAAPVPSPVLQQVVQAPVAAIQDAAAAHLAPAQPAAETVAQPIAPQPVLAVTEPAAQSEATVMPQAPVTPGVAPVSPAAAVPEPVESLLSMPGPATTIAQIEEQLQQSITEMRPPVATTEAPALQAPMPEPAGTETIATEAPAAAEPAPVLEQPAEATVPPAPLSEPAEAQSAAPAVPAQQLAASQSAVLPQAAPVQAAALPGADPAPPITAETPTAAKKKRRLPKLKLPIKLPLKHPYALPAGLTMVFVVGLVGFSAFLYHRTQDTVRASMAQHSISAANRGTVVQEIDNATFDIDLIIHNIGSGGDFAPEDLNDQSLGL